MPWPPPHQKGPGDFVIIHPEFAIVFEVKNHQPPIKAFEPTAAGFQTFKTWFEDAYLLSPRQAKRRRRRLGVLYQLDRDVRRILTNGVEGIIPQRVLPVVVSPQDLIFSYDFYRIIDREIRNSRILTDRRVLPPLAMSIGDLEFFLALDYGARGHAFSEILLAKASDAAGRNTTWKQVASTFGLTATIAPRIKRTLDELADRGLRLLESDKVRVFPPS
jgi:hypothetical protein